ncbi:MarR family winged helix-turn-helix transcriptional regulator [Epibacterium ulvae]|uniref:MarR family winged helix-turn-helix transcriptional regulator n=1 Tax=Epibacterium ulvae TaxID=1156985 RepID=UPI001BFCABBF|nr:MarR family winged helix-turn-helix transcriptional regulator [Epibacterium ulvae]MBT8154645.1 MarR family winged helix-turn-helix transcriptional regulator [Epibacterium ulvae]
MSTEEKKKEAAMPKDYQLHDRLGFRLSRLSRMMQARLETSLAEHDLTRLKWCVLSGVGIEGRTAPSELAAHIGITRPAISKLIKTMIAEGLIERNLVEADGRSRQISVTQLGKDKLNSCWHMVESNQEHFLEKLTAYERTMLNELLNTLIKDEFDIFDDI